MLSDKSYQELLGRASNIKSTKDFINLLTEYKEYIPKNLKSILENSTPEFEDSIAGIS